jgi:hypothetical protein
VVEALHAVAVLVAVLLVGVAVAVELDALAVLAVAGASRPRIILISAMDFYYEVGARPAHQGAPVYLSSAPYLKVNLKDYSAPGEP